MYYVKADIIIRTSDTGTCFKIFFNFNCSSSKTVKKLNFSVLSCTTLSKIFISSACLSFIPGKFNSYENMEKCRK